MVSLDSCWNIVFYVDIEEWQSTEYLSYAWGRNGLNVIVDVQTKFLEDQRTSGTLQTKNSGCIVLVKHGKSQCEVPIEAQNLGIK